MAKFLRVGVNQYSKLGVRRKNKQKYRRANGIDNKVRLNMKGHLRNVRIGFKSEKKTRALVNGLVPVMIKDVNGLKNLKKGEIAIVEKVGDKRKLEIAKFALEKNIRLYNLNSKEFISKKEEEQKLRKEEKSLRDKKKTEKEKKAKEAEKKEEKKEEKAEEKKTENIEQKVEENKEDKK